MFKYLCKKALPLYIQLWPTYYWIACWSAPTTPARPLKYWKSLRITTRKGKWHSELVATIKEGTI
jgi:hypothetical protein